jgi:indole-3-glycerol phosphate synthase
VSTILDQIVATKRQEMEEASRHVSERALAAKLEGAPAPRDFRAALESVPEIQVIAEVKKASPSAGVIRADFDPVAIARIYADHGAAAISVLTDEPYFQGRLAYLSAIRAAVRPPLLRKDFILDRYQLLEARLAGADAVLLIAEVLEGPLLTQLVQEAAGLGLQSLVELYDAAHLSRVLDCGSPLIGINNRDLRTFAVRLEHTLELIERIPKGNCVISESGIRARADVLRLEDAGVRAILVGETLMRAADIGAELDALLGKDGRTGSM